MLLSIVSLLAFMLTARAGTPPMSLLTELHHRQAHSYGDDYKFSPKDGWTSLTASDEPYKYQNGTHAAPEASKPHKAAHDHDASRSHARGLVERGLESISGSLGSLSKIFKGLKGTGKPEDVVITWYTGHDLQNPSCWPKSDWAPTDESFACALTLDGWKNKPSCFKFLELCNTPKKCVFVRVIDTCAGCAKGSRHVDLTRAAFGQLADFDQGVLNVQMRMANEPDLWSEKLWGPKMGGHK